MVKIIRKEKQVEQHNIRDYDYFVSKDINDEKLFFYLICSLEQDTGESYYIVDVDSNMIFNIDITTATIENFLKDYTGGCEKLEFASLNNESNEITIQV